MSADSGWLAVQWAELVPVADVYERAILTVMAHRANSDGTDSFPSVTTMAEFCMCEETSVKRRLAKLRARKFIAYGDQTVAAYIDPRYRPKVYDLLIPYEFYGKPQLEAINRGRAQRGLGPITPENRPPLVVPERSRKQRADTGTTRKKPTRPQLKAM